jgi:hypothetical protein
MTRLRGSQFTLVLGVVFKLLAKVVEWVFIDSSSFFEGRRGGLGGKTGRL